MNKTWLLSILGISLLLLSLLKAHELASLSPYYRSERVIKLSSFSDARLKVQKRDLDYLKLWESVLTGRAAPLSQWMKERYRRLGLNHLFTPSGFHISAVLFPFFKIIKNQYYQLFLIIILGIGAFFLPGMSALKRMLLIKGHQKVLGQKLGFCMALILDILFGSFQEGALSFTYSFLFIGIIYSGLKGLSLSIWFFIAQIILAYFQGNHVSPLLLIFSPLLNLSFAIIMPLLFLLAFPLWDWQLSIGLLLIKGLQFLVDMCAYICSIFPCFEVHVGVLLGVSLLLYKRWKLFLILSLLLSPNLNTDRERLGSWSNEYAPRGKILKTIYREKDVRVYFEDGSCRLKLVKGFWWENCSPRRRSNSKSIMKLSYPLKGSRKSSLRG